MNTNEYCAQPCVLLRRHDQFSKSVANELINENSITFRCGSPQKLDDVVLRRHPVPYPLSNGRRRWRENSLRNILLRTRTYRSVLKYFGRNHYIFFFMRERETTFFSCFSMNPRYFHIDFRREKYVIIPKRF